MIAQHLSSCSYCFSRVRRESEKNKEKSKIKKFGHPCLPGIHFCSRASLNLSGFLPDKRKKRGERKQTISLAFT